MLKPYDMSSIIITGPKAIQEAIIRELHELKVLHIVEHSKNELADIGKPLGSAANLSEALVKVRALIAALGIKKEEAEFEPKKGLPDIMPAAKKLGENLNTALDELKKCQELISKNEATKQELKILKDINIPLEYFTAYRSLAYFTGYVKDASALNEEISKLTKNFMLLNSGAKKRSFIFLLASEMFLSRQLEKAEAPLKFASTQSSFLVKGWVPAEDLNKTIERLNKAGKNKVFVHFEPAKAHDNVPIKLKNPRFAKPFEFFMDLYSMPTYREIDPTFFVFLTFPIFFGIMLGDVGYGIASFAIFWLLKRKMPKAKNFFNILILASFATILFGFFFGEFFGREFIHPIISREHEMFKLLYISIAIGIVHVNTGLVIGFINELKRHGLMHAVYAKASWIVLEIGIALLALSYLNKIAVSPLFGAVFLGASILMLLKGEGVKGLI